MFFQTDIKQWCCCCWSAVSLSVGHINWCRSHYVVCGRLPSFFTSLSLPPSLASVSFAWTHHGTGSCGQGGRVYERKRQRNKHHKGDEGEDPTSNRPHYQLKRENTNKNNPRWPLPPPARWLVCFPASSRPKRQANRGLTFCNFHLNALMFGFS